MSASNTHSSLQPNMHPWKGSTVRARSDWHRVGRVCQSSPVTCKDVFPTSGGTSWLTATWHWPLASSSDPLVSLPVSFQVSRVCRSLPGTSLKAKDDTAGSCRSSTRRCFQRRFICASRSLEPGRVSRFTPSTRFLVCRESGRTCYVGVMRIVLLQHSILSFEHSSIC
jgi:hypothetical protein